MSKVLLEAARRPLVFGNMTTGELIREAEHTFPNPSPIVKMMLAHLQGEHRHHDRTGTPAGDPHAQACTVHTEEHQCPTCGGTISAKVIA